MSRQNAALESPRTFEGAWAGHWRPRRPLSGDVKDLDRPRLRRRTRVRALGFPYVESNPLVLRSFLVIDHDNGDAGRAAERAGLPEPSWVALNPSTGAGHIGYALTAPVCLTDTARRGPVNLAARCETGLIRLLGGDIAYGGRITKNPHHDAHTTIWGPLTALYGLRDLARVLDDLGALPKAGNPRKHLRSSTVGRNVALFDTTRHWAYPRRGHHTRLSTWEHAVYAHAWHLNETIIADEFTAGPLTTTEVRAIAGSIARWTWRNITRTYRQEQARRGRAGDSRPGGRAGGLVTAATGGRDRLITHNINRRIDRHRALELDQELGRGR